MGEAAVGHCNPIIKHFVRAARLATNSLAFLGDSFFWVNFQQDISRCDRIQGPHSKERAALQVNLQGTRSRTQLINLVPYKLVEILGIEHLDTLPMHSGLKVKRSNNCHEKQ